MRVDRHHRGGARAGLPAARGAAARPGAKVEITSRGYGQTREFLELHGLEAKVLGHHGGRSALGKAGTPVYTVLGGRLGAVDEQLIAEGRPLPLTDPGAVPVRKREQGPGERPPGPASFLDLLLPV